MGMESETAVPAWVQLCGNLAPFAAIFVNLAPMPTIQQISRDKTVGTLPLLPYSSMFANCFLWVVYGLLKEEVKVWGTNIIGLILASYYFLRFSKYAPEKSPTLPGSIEQHIRANIVVIGSTFAVVYISPLTDPASFIGNVAVFFCIAMFGSPLAALKTVLQTKSAKSIPLPFTVATIANCFLWTIFGLFEMHDVNIYVPNILGLVFGLAQLSLRFIYGDGNGSKAETEAGLVV